MVSRGFTASPWFVLVMSLAIAAGVTTVGLLNVDHYHMALRMTDPVWLIVAMILAELLTGLLIVALALLNGKGLLNCLLIILCSLLPAMFGSIPQDYWILQWGLTPYTRFVAHSPVSVVSEMWLAASIVALVRSIRRART